MTPIRPPRRRRLAPGASRRARRGGGRLPLHPGRPARPGGAGWLDGHIPGAAFVSVGEDLSGELRDGGSDGGRAPLPQARDFQASARRAGHLARTSLVVAYDEAGEGGASRLWWLLRHFGHESVGVLDGALGAWTEAGGELRTGDEQTAPGRLRRRRRAPGRHGRPRGRPGRIACACSTRASPSAFAASTEPMDPVAGHIPGAQQRAVARGHPGRPLRRRGRAETSNSATSPSWPTAARGSPPRTWCWPRRSPGSRAGSTPGSWSEWSRRGLPVETGE